MQLWEIKQHILADNDPVQLINPFDDNDVLSNPEYMSFGNPIVIHDEHDDELTLPWISADKVYSHVAPVILKMSNFNEKMERNERWFSNYFFAFDSGYKMCLGVDAAGYIDVSGYTGEKGTDLFVSLYLTRGPYDYDLQRSGHWPMRGAFTVELLNQFYVLHRKNVYFINIETCRMCTERVYWEGHLAQGFTDTHFISLRRIGGSRRHCQGGQGGARSFSVQQCLFH